jgi:hypothetical protein
MVQLVNRASDVRVTEINLSSVITSSSSAAGCIGIISKQGSSEPRHFTNATDFLYEYGNPDPSVSMTIQSALNFFTEGNDLWAIRAVGSDSRVAGVLLYVNSGVLGIVGTGNLDPGNTDLNALATLLVPGAQGVALFYANRGPGSYGNANSIGIKSLSPVAPTMATTPFTQGTGTLAIGAYTYSITSINAAGESLPVIQAVTTVAASKSVNLFWNPVTDAVGYKIYRALGGTVGLLATVGGGVATYTDTGAVSVNVALPIPTVGAVSTEFVVTVTDNTTPLAGPLETWTCTLQPKISSAGVQMELENRINPFSSYIKVESGVAGLGAVPAMKNMATTAMLGGDSGTAPTSSAVALALQVFGNKQLFGVNLLINGGIADPVMQLAMDTLVQARGDAVALLDVPAASQKFQSAIDYRNLTLNLNSSYSALFNPDLLQADLINGQQVYNPPSGWAAALCARTDRVANPAFSIAGLNRGLLNVLKARYQFDDGQATAMYNAQVNYTRTFVGQGIALWEQQTLAGQRSALSWLSVRRITNVIKTSLYKFLLYALQEMNTDNVRRQLVNSCNSYLSTVRAADGIYDFNVTCDNSNNPPAARDAGILVMTVIIIPNIPIHEIQLQVVISKSGVSFKETLSAVNGGV